MNSKRMNLTPWFRRLLASGLLGITLVAVQSVTPLHADDAARAIPRESRGSYDYFEARRERRHNSESMQKSIQDRLQDAYLDIEGAGQTIHYDKNTLRVEMVHVDLRPRRSVGGTEIYIEPGAGTSLDVKQLLDAYYSQVGYPDPDSEKSILYIDSNGQIVRETRLQGFQKHGWFAHGRRTEAGVWRAATRDNYVQHEQTPEGRHLFKVLHRHESETSPSFHIPEPRDRADGGRGIRAADSTAQVSFSSGVEDYLTVWGLYPSVQARIIHDLEMEKMLQQAERSREEQRALVEERMEEGYREFEQAQRARRVGETLDELRADEGYREYRAFLGTRPYDVNTLEGQDRAYADWQALQRKHADVAPDDVSTEGTDTPRIAASIPTHKPDLLADMYLAVENLYRDLLDPGKVESEEVATDVATMAMQTLNALSADALQRLARVGSDGHAYEAVRVDSAAPAQIPPVPPASTAAIRSTVEEQLATRDLLADPDAQAKMRRLKVQAQRIHEMEESMAYLLSMRERGTTFPESVLRIRQGELDRAREAYEAGKRETGWTDAQIAAAHVPSFFSHTVSTGAAYAPRTESAPVGDRGVAHAPSPSPPSTQAEAQGSTDGTRPQPPDGFELPIDYDFGWEPDYSDAIVLVDEGRHFRAGNKDQRAYGLAVDWYDESRRQVRTARGVRNGEPHGRQTFWNAEGVITKVVEWKDGARHGTMVEWYPDGTKRSVEDYRNNRRHGRYLRWHPNGQQLLVGQYHEGQRAGTWEEWYPNGNRNRTYSFQNGRAHDLETRWRQDGSKFAEIHMENGRIHGPYTTWHSNGQMEMQGTYRDGKRHGRFVVWWPDGRVRSDSRFVDGKDVGATQ